MMKVVNPPGIIPGGEPFSPAWIVGDMVYTAGQIGITPEGNIPADAKEQAVQLCENLMTVLKAAGVDASKVFKNTIYLTDFNNLPILNEVLLQYFKPPFAASTCVQVAGLFGGALFEVEVIATRPA